MAAKKKGTEGAAVPAKKRQKKEKVIFTRGKRKEAVARASVRKGAGRVTLNRVSIDALGNKYLRSMLYEPIVLAGNAAKEIDIDVGVYGGGAMGQAEAARMAIARGLVEFVGDEELRKKMLAHDRHMLREDSRRVEPKKYKGPKARARFQKSYR